MTTHFHPILVAGAFCVFAGTAFAQGGNNGNGGNRPNVTSTQREAMRAQMRERQIRQALTSAGFTDATIQDPIVALAKMEQTTAAKFLPKINALRVALANSATGNANGNNATGNTTNGNTVASLLADYRSAIADTQNARASAISDLDKSVYFSTNPTLEALLTMLGIIGDETGFVSSLAGQAQLPGASGAMRGGPDGGLGGGMGGGPGGMNANAGGMAPPPPDGGN